LKNISSVTGITKTMRVWSSALVAYWNAEAIWIKDPISRARNAFWIEPVPFIAASINGFSIIRFRKETGSIRKIISRIASQTLSSSRVIGLALITYRNTHSFCIEDPIVWARLADTLQPRSTSQISRLCIIRRWEWACSVDYIITSIAGAA
jgi:hypothetical protein